MAFIRPVLLYQRIDTDSAWMDCLALSYAACVFRREVTIADVRGRLAGERATFERRLVDSADYCHRHHTSFRGCHCLTSGGAPNHERVRHLMWTTCALLREAMSAWPEFEDYRYPEDGESLVVISWAFAAIHPWRDLFAVGGAFHADGPGLCAHYCLPD